MAAISSGLPISNEIRLSHLSGPVSIKIVVPHQEFLEKYPRAPLFILLGDLHFSDKNLCDETVPNTCRVYRIEFLELLCKLLQIHTREFGTKIYEKIDFYIEGGDIHRTKTVHKGPDKNQPMPMLWNLMIECNNSIGSPIKTPYNRIENVRWQSGDIRSWGLKPFPIQTKIDEMRRIGREKGFFNKQTLQLQYVEPKYCNIYEFLKKLLDETPNPLREKHSDNTYFSLMIMSLSAAVKRNNLCFDRTAPKITVDELYTEYIDNDTSMINYEIKQIHTHYDTVFIRNKCKEYITYCVNKMINSLTEFPNKSIVFIMAINIHKNLTDTCSDDAFSDANVKNLTIDGLVADLRIKHLYEYKKHLHLLKSVLLDTESISTDLYTLVRSFKRMIVQDPYNSYSIINICYFGNAHITEMHHFLTNILGPKCYETVLNIEYETKNDKDLANRCLEFTDTVIKQMPSIAQLLNNMRTTRNNKLYNTFTDQGSALNPGRPVPGMDMSCSIS
jgi:hypothetical protein